MIKLQTLITFGALSCAFTASGAVILSETFDDASSVNDWVMSGGSEATSSFQWSSTTGNPPGSLEMTASHFLGEDAPSGVGSDTFYTLEVGGLSFGTDLVTVGFDGMLLSGLPGTAIHVRINNNFFGAIHPNFNTTTFTEFSQTFNVSQGFEGTDTLTLQFQFAMGPVANAGGSFAVDNITVIPEPATYAALIGLLALGLVLLRRRANRA